MKTIEDQTIFLKDYETSEYLINETNLSFDIFEDFTTVSSSLEMEYSKSSSENLPNLVFNAVDMEIVEIKINETVITQEQFIFKNEELIIPSTILSDVIKSDKTFTFSSSVIIKPHENTALEGFYKSGEILCSQNEPEGFRRITPYIDRPDVMSKFTTKIVADKSVYPNLLSNGDCTDKGDLSDGRHFATWVDPFKKPSYLFAIVAGKLGQVSGTYTTKTGKIKNLEIYCDPGNEDRCHFAMESLKKSMLWDEDRWGLEYDLNTYMIVAVDSFNMGAMENKGLNIFNSSCVLADPKSATDHDYALIEAVVGHEYFHNWTGNRVTCRDWFQLTLKEGLTVFRDQEFSSDLQVRSVKRIEDVKYFKTYQFSEDQGPMAHPIRPQSYVEINNFYTLTVYEKGSEVIRMIHTILGEDVFRKGIDKYFELFDGMAVTTEDFISAMEQVSGRDFGQFKNTWYNFAGTPVVKVIKTYNDNKLSLNFEQSHSPFVKIDKKSPYHMPIKLSLYTKDGEKVKTELLELKDYNYTFECETSEDLIPSINENFTAPVKLIFDYNDNDLAILMGSCEDPFNKYESGQILSKRLILKLIKHVKEGNDLSIKNLSEDFLSAYGTLLKDKVSDKTFVSYALTLPSIEEIIGEQNTIDIDATYKAINWLSENLSRHFQNEILEIYNECKSHLEGKGYHFHKEDNSFRALLNKTLGLLSATKEEKYFDLAVEQYQKSQNMTERLSAFKVICDYNTEKSVQIIDEFYGECKNDNLVLNKWFINVASTKKPGAIARAKALMERDAFDIKVPNHVRSVIRGFASNFIELHKEDGSGYRYIGDFIKTYDKVNPTIASGLVQIFNKASRLDNGRKEIIKSILQDLEKFGLSKNTGEIVRKTLNTIK